MTEPNPITIDAGAPATPPAGTPPEPVNPIAEAHRVLADFEARARAGELGPPPAPPPSWMGTMQDIERDAELARVHQSIVDPFQGSRFFLQHAAAITRHGERVRYFRER